MYYYSGTTNENHISYPTPYLCLKARLFQAFVNRKILILLFPLIVLQIITTIMKKLLSAEQSFQVHSSQMISNSLDADLKSAIDQINIDMAQRQNGIIMAANFTNLMANNFIHTLSEDYKNNINSTITAALASYEKSPKNYTREFDDFKQNITDTLNNTRKTILSSLKKQNISILKLVEQLKSQSLSVNTGLDFSALTINYTWIPELLTDKSTELIAALKQLEKQVNIVDTPKRYEQLNSMKNNMSTIFKDIHSLESRKNKSIINLFTNLVTTSSNVSNFTYTNRSMLLYSNTSKYDPNLEEQLETVVLKHRLMLGILAALLITFQCSYEWICFQSEQRASKIVKYELELTQNHLAVVHHTINQLSNSVAAMAIEAINSFKYRKGTYLSEKTEVRLYWVSYFLLGSQSNIPDLMLFVLILLLSFTFIDDFHKLMLTNTIRTAMVNSLHIDQNFANEAAKYQTDNIAIINNLCDNHTQRIISALESWEKSFVKILSANYNNSLVLLIPHTSIQQSVLDTTSLINQHHKLISQNLTTLPVLPNLVSSTKDNITSPFTTTSVTDALVHCFSALSSSALISAAVLAAVLVLYTVSALGAAFGANLRSARFAGCTDAGIERLSLR